MECNCSIMTYIGVILVIFPAFLQIGDTCVFPVGLQNNNWTSSGYRNMEFYVSDVIFTDDTNVERNYTCHLSSGANYIIKSPDVIEFSSSANYYYCFQLTQVSASSFSYYIPTVQEIPLNHRKKTFPNTTSVTSVGQVCDMAAIVAELYVLVLRDNPSSAAVSCITPLLGNFQYTVTSSTGVTSCGTSPGDGVLGICDSNSTTLVYDYAACSTQLSYSSSGILYCIASSSAVVGSTTTFYQILYNSDTSPTYQFACMAVSYNTTDGSLVHVSEIHTVCQENQNATTAVTGGNLIFFQANITCVPPTDKISSSNIGLIVGLVIAALIILAIIAALLFYFLYWKKRDPNAGKPIVENTKPRFEDPDKEDEIEDLELEDARSEPLTRDDIVFTAESPSFIPNGHTNMANGLVNGHIGDKKTTKSIKKDKDSGVGSSDFSRPSDTQITPRLNREREAMVIFNGDEKVISGNDSRVVPSENPQSFRRFEPDTGGPSGGILTLQGLDGEDGDGVGELADLSGRDIPYPTLSREKTNLLPPIETIDPEKDN